MYWMCSFHAHETICNQFYAADMKFHTRCTSEWVIQQCASVAHPPFYYGIHKQRWPSLISISISNAKHGGSLIYFLAHTASPAHSLTRSLFLSLASCAYRQRGHPLPTTATTTHGGYCPSTYSIHYYRDTRYRGYVALTTDTTNTMSNNDVNSTAAEAMAAAAAIVASSTAAQDPNHHHQQQQHQAAIDALILQEMQQALFSPNAATPLFDSFTSPVMGTTTMSDFMDTPLFNDIDDFPMTADTSGGDLDSLFPSTAATTTASMFGQAATAAIVAAATNSNNTTPLMPTHDMFPETSGGTPSISTATDALLRSGGVGTKVQALADGSFAVTTKRGTITLNSAQVNELLHGSSRRKRPATATTPTPTTAAAPAATMMRGINVTTAPLGAGGVRLLASTAPSPATPMMDTIMAGTASPSPATGQKRSPTTSTEAMDALARKREKNTAAAQRSRLRKVLKMEALELRVRELEADNVDLRTKLAVLENERKGWRSKEEEMREQIRMLERRLDEAHRSLRDEISSRREAHA
ncbi:hypothetical protein SYNPS1DRAFT_30067 [Syncephalis pseudoplumigaleata]|uniref:BZIP domain-containing protein n=1 Tax=Syncephalis pseudoplumigaleata TaxID=1712513 RepID=A0A4P9YW76_9FUNG|nr:hypothetical protein SYNPS1DRAFT_30067 [Syncephalis pseudoplumigaleata]|eukprot:RKP24164.1 hypothetical protein SYNPS1DRAFT_30067 [Syncephalis pseudoplumigaleata]